MGRVQICTVDFIKSSILLDLIWSDGPDSAPMGINPPQPHPLIWIICLFPSSATLPADPGPAASFTVFSGASRGCWNIENIISIKPSFTLPTICSFSLPGVRRSLRHHLSSTATFRRRCYLRWAIFTVFSGCYQGFYFEK